jgi:Tol biopolymer transport system component
MAIKSGQRLGPYEVLSAIGAGGMGEVYCARDTRLDRIVAIKVLPTHLADRSELRERFEREAKTIASLNHPHICTLYDIGHQDGIDYLVMEYLEGGTVAQRLQKGALPLEEVLQYAIEIADALDKAHRNGITHRDLKPGNIMLTKAGTKLLDFGLAKLKQEVAPATPVSQLPTVNTAITGEGTILGTLQYMAPEQVEGKTNQIDARTDIFAFGVVVYEMATGRKAFEGKTSASVMAKILEVDPPSMTSLQPMTPPALDRVVKRCLAKEPEKRWQTASDLCEELKWISEGGSQGTSATSAAAKGVHTLGGRGLILSLGTSLLGAVIAGFIIWNLKPAPPPIRPVTRSVITLPPGDRLPRADEPFIALSPDGTQLAYVATRGSTQQIYLRAMDSFEARPIAGTEGATSPFFSPDGQSLGFLASGKLKKVSVAGGAATTLGDAGLLRGASWGSAGMIAFAPTNASPLQEVPDAGGASEPLTHFKKGESSHRWPYFLPGGKAVLFASGPQGTDGQLAVQAVKSGERKNLVQGAMQPRYAPSGHLLYVQSGTLVAAPFDAERMAVTGAAVPMVENVLQSAVTGAAQYSTSVTGSLVYVSGKVDAEQRNLVLVSRAGKEQLLAVPVNNYERPNLSPDENKVAVNIQEQGSQIWTYDLMRGTLTRLTFEGGLNITPLWTRDGERIAYCSNREGPLRIFWQRADGSGGAEKLTGSDYTRVPISWSGDGQVLAFDEISPTTGYDIWVLNLKDHKEQPFLRTRFYEASPMFSPDGRWIAYVSDESGRYEIYVQPYPGPGGKWQVSTDGGTEPHWTMNGRELVYRNGDKVIVVGVATQPTFSTGKPRILFEGPYVSPAINTRTWDASLDGQRFVMLKPVRQEQAPPTQINVVLNWFEELKQKVPTGKK